MKICRRLWTLAVGLGLMFSSAAFALAPPPIPVAVTPASGNPGSVVQPVFSLDVAGFDFESLDLTLTFSDPMLTFNLGSSSVTLNGVTQAWTALPLFLAVSPSTVGDVTSISFSSFTLAPEAFTGPLVLRPNFTVRGTAPLGGTLVSIAGSVGSEPLVGERYFDSSATVTVTAVPEPEFWLMWLGGLGLLALRRVRRPA
ncbi:MAG: hypothetical protein JNM97_16750 [Rhodoferax sp.]|nr:hypothetical protein [Rhodoferax sp.]